MTAHIEAIAGKGGGLAGSSLPDLIDIDLVVVAGWVLALAGIALAISHMGARTRVEHDGVTPRFHILQAYTIFEHLSLVIAPAATAALVVSLRAGEVGSGIWMFIAVFLAGAVFAGENYPYHLMTWARRILHVLVPVGGVSLFLISALLGAGPAFLGASVAALVSAVVVRSIGALLVRMLESKRPLRLAVIGPAKLSRRLNVELRESGVYKFTVVGFLDFAGVAEPQVFDAKAAGPEAAESQAAELIAPESQSTEPSHSHEDRDCLGTLAEVSTVCEKNRIDILALSPEARSSPELREAAEKMLKLEVRLTSLEAIHERLLGYVPMGMIDATWIAYLLSLRFRYGLRPMGKRAFDLIVGSAVMIPVLPLVGIFAALVKIGDGGPAFYRQRRVGEKGREFDIVKLRSMRVGAETPDRPVWSSEGDPRVTAIGRVMRKTHLDEMPQIFDVVRGWMTIVGPRPERPAFVEALERRIPFYSRRRLVCPGITGWAQVRSGYASNVIDSAWKVSHDLFYLKKRSPIFDLLIMIETLRAVALGSRYRLPLPEPDHFFHEDSPPSGDPLLSQIADET